MSTETLAIEMDRLTKDFGKITAVNEVTLKVRSGETLGLIGPNGAGKSTTLRMLMGMLRPSSGTVHVLGMDVLRSASKIKQRVGYVPESHNIYRWMTVQQAIKFVRAMYSTWNDTLAATMADKFQLRSNQQVRNLSHGMLAKLALLIAVAHEPKVLVLDEPLSGLDPIAREDFIDGVLQGICGSDQTVLFSSHQLDEVRRLADRVAIMYGGRILIQRPISELLDSMRRVRAVILNDQIPRMAPANTVRQHVEEREWLLTIDGYGPETVERIHAENRVEIVEVCKMSLDDIFQDVIRGARRDAV